MTAPASYNGVVRQDRRAMMGAMADELTEAVEEVAEEAAAETAEEVVEQHENDTPDETTVVVVNDEPDSPVTELGEALDTAETIRAIARDEAQQACEELARSFGEVVGTSIATAIATHEATMPHNAVMETVEVEQDEPPEPQHWWFRNRGRNNVA